MRASRITPAAVALAVVGLWATGTRAQVYPDVHPVPRTTDAAALRAAASNREVHERFNIGLDAFARSDWSAARAEFTRVLALHPTEPLSSTAHYDLGITLVNLHDYSGAQAEFVAAIALDSDFLAARSNLVTVQLLRGDLTAARKSADELIARAPASARALYLRGLTALRTGDAEGAKRSFGALLSRNPSYAVAHYDLALAAIQLNKFDDAERELRAALDLSPSYARARFALGTVLLRTGKRDAARAAFAEAARASQDPELTSLANSMQDSLAH